jgi:hypothetical protein
VRKAKSWDSNIISGSKLGLCGPGSSVGIATGYRLDGPGIESRWGRDFSKGPLSNKTLKKYINCFKVAMKTVYFYLLNKYMIRYDI